MRIVAELGRSRTLAGLLAALLAGACGREEPVGSAVLITIDTTIPEALSAYGAPLAVTPNLARLEPRGVVFENARTTAPITLPAHASMLTGLYPLRHAVRTNGLMALSDGAETVAERARERGHRTAAFVGAVVLNGEFGLDQGFEVYDQPDAISRHHMGERGADAVTEGALEWLETVGEGEPFFLWVHYFDPHQPLEAPARFVQQAGGDPYLGEVAHVDYQVGRVLDALEAMDGRGTPATIVVVSDHGEGQGRHGESTHGALAFDSTLRVPLLVAPPAGQAGASGGTRSPALVSVTDVHPTLLAAMDLGRADGVDGLDLLGDGLEDRGGVYFESYFGAISFGWSHLSGWVDERGKYIHSSEPEFYELDADPGELRDLIHERAEMVRASRDQMARLDALPKLELASPAEGERAEELLAEIRELGYADLGGSTSDLAGVLATESGRPSPASRMEAYQSYQLAEQLNGSGQPGRAAELLRVIVSENPNNHGAWLTLGNALVQVGRHREALEALDRAASTGAGDHRGLHINRAVAHHSLGEIDLAIEHYKEVMEIDPRLDEFRETLVKLLERAGRHEEAAQYRR